MRIYDYLGIVNPKRGIQRYINLPVRVSLLCIIAVTAINSTLKKAGEAEIIVVAFNIILAFAETAFCYSSVSVDKKNIGFYKTIPNMREILKKSLIIDEIRRIADIVFTFLCFGIIIYIHFGKLRVFSMTGCMATTYILAEFLIFTVRRWNNIYITLFLYMPVSIVFSVINVAPITMAIDEIYPAPLAFGLLIPAVCIGIFANKYVIKKLTNCRSDLK